MSKGPPRAVSWEERPFRIQLLTSRGCGRHDRPLRGSEDRVDGDSVFGAGLQPLDHVVAVRVPQVHMLNAAFWNHERSDTEIPPLKAWHMRDLGGHLSSETKRSPLFDPPNSAVCLHHELPGAT